jgi:hypothetical protein
VEDPDFAGKQALEAARKKAESIKQQEALAKKELEEIERMKAEKAAALAAAQPPPPAPAPPPPAPTPAPFLPSQARSRGLGQAGSSCDNSGASSGEGQASQAFDV